MKTIQISSKGKNVQFTTKSVTIDGKEYVYSHISELRHSQAKRIYGFKCDGEVVMLPYEEKDAQVLKVIFSQVQQMHRKPAPPAPKSETPEAPVTEAPATEAPAEVSPAASEEVPAEEIPATETPVEEIPAEGEPAEAVTPIEEIPASAEEIPASAEEVPAETPEDVIPAEEVPATEEIPAAEEVPTEPILSAKERKKQEKEQRKAEKEALKREKQAAKAAAKSGDTVAYAEAAGTEVAPEVKSARFKKGIIIFVIILAVFALLGVAYYFLIGPASDPQIGPNTTDQTQYNDIDDMINDLEQ